MSNKSTKSKSTTTTTTKVTPVKKSPLPVVKSAVKKPVTAKKPEPVKKPTPVTKPKLQEKIVFTKVNNVASTARPQTDKHIAGVITFSELMSKMTQNLSSVK